MKCRHCTTQLENTFLDLGFAPPSNAYLSADKLTQPEKYFPLKIKVCSHCWLVQTEDYAQADELFSADYAYFSSTSTSWLAHAEHYAQTIITQLGLTEDCNVIELASNDGYLLKNFLTAGIPCIGIEPTASTAAIAEKLGIPVLREFFGEALGKRLAFEGKQADLIIGNNVYAHVPDINNFTRGIKAALKPGGTVTLEFPHLMQLLLNTQFDTVYHEHFSYLSLYTVTQIFERAGLKVLNAKELTTHGGSLRVYGSHSDDSRPTSSNVVLLLENEIKNGLQELSTYHNFQARADTIKNDFLLFLLEQKKANKSVVAYGAAAKGNTLLNYAGVKPDLLKFVFDAANFKQNKYMPGSHIPILSPARILAADPDFVVILPWNISAEVQDQLRSQGMTRTKFVTVVPELKVL